MSAHDPAYPTYGGQYKGMTKREVFALEIFAAMISTGISIDINVSVSIGQQRAGAAVALADTLLKVLEETK